MTVDHAGRAVATPAIAVRLGDQVHTLDPHAGVAVIGRDSAAAVHLADERISRSHVRLEPGQDAWQAIDTSTNGMYLDGVRRSSVLITGPTTLHLGAPEGIPVSLTPSVAGAPGDPGAQVDPSTEATGVIELPEGDEDDEWWGADSDPGVARAGRAVAARRAELEITQRGLAKDKVINAGTLIAFEKGRSRRAAPPWPNWKRRCNGRPARSRGFAAVKRHYRALPLRRSGTTPPRCSPTPCAPR